MKITCIIVEDIQIAADFLVKFCERSGIIDVKGHFTNVEEALQFLDDNRPELIFLDVEMPGASGFDLLDRLTYKPRIVLTTSKTEYAFEAFQHNVTDFLKKPFTYNRFMDALQKIQQTPAPPPTQSPQTTDEADHLFIKADEKLIKIIKEEILYIESMRDYVKFVTSAKTYITYSTLKSMEERLSGQIFIKVHRSYIINIHKIEDIRGNIVYVNGTPIPIGKGHKDELSARLNIL